MVLLLCAINTFLLSYTILPYGKSYGKNQSQEYRVGMLHCKCLFYIENRDIFGERRSAVVPFILDDYSLALIMSAKTKAIIGAMARISIMVGMPPMMMGMTAIAVRSYNKKEINT